MTQILHWNARMDNTDFSNEAEVTYGQKFMVSSNRNERPADKR